MVLAPLPHPFHMDRAAEGIAVVGLLQPTALAGRFARLSTEGLRTVMLASNIAGGRIKEDLTMLPLALAGVLSHWPGSPQANDRPLAAWKEENREENTGESRGKKREEI